ncbi:MAG: TIGR00300 family protein [Theionarchaea archaeon]|nr:TIGR00300 family protein [Theionarchaea archaeon]MBU7038035.1 TIGR00300 family protein [Theionarchaea archaeon]
MDENNPRPVEKTVRLQGHLVDSDIMSSVLDRIVSLEGKFRFEEFDIGKTNVDPSVTILTVFAKDNEHMGLILGELTQLGAFVDDENAMVEKAPADCVVPENFYSTTNHRTAIRIKGTWVEVEEQMMDSVIVVSPDYERASCKKLRYIEKDDYVVVGTRGIHVMPREKSRKRSIFDFMHSVVSSERNITVFVKQAAHIMKDIKSAGGKTCVVPGPAVIHTGGSRHLASLIRKGYIDGLLSGNALAVHDVETMLFGTSLGVSLESGQSVEGGHRHHMAAINHINKYGGLRGLFEKGLLTSGIFFECLSHDVPFALAGSIRDDGPIPDVITDVRTAQEQYIELLEDVDLVLMLASMLHSIAVGNVLPSYVRTICVDINPAAVTKLVDRGSFQAFGIVTDVSLFLRVLDSLL